MKITFSPARHAERPDIETRGETLIIDGEAFDLSTIPEGATLPGEAVASMWVCGPVERIDGQLHLTLLLSHDADAPNGTMFPDPVRVTSDGPVPMPPYARTTEKEPRG